MSGVVNKAVQHHLVCCREYRDARAGRVGLAHGGWESRVDGLPIFGLPREIAGRFPSTVAGVDPGDQMRLKLGDTPTGRATSGPECIQHEKETECNRCQVILLIDEKGCKGTQQLRNVSKPAS